MSLWVCTPYAPPIDIIETERSLFGAKKAYFKGFLAFLYIIYREK